MLDVLVQLMPNFGSEKEYVLNKYRTAIADSKIDSSILPLLDIINTHPDFYTTSSCAGRIVLLAVAEPGAKNESIMINKWHDKISKDELKKSLAKWNKYSYLYFLAQSPIFHVTTHKLSAAVQLRNLAESAGFKYSSIRSIKPIKVGKSKESSIKSEYSETNLDTRITVEILGTERLNLPLGHDGNILTDDPYLDLIVDLANKSITDANYKIIKLEQVLKDKLKDI